MAYISTEYCKECERDVEMINHQCPHCAARKARQEMAAWQALDVDEKLLDIHKRLLTLENRREIRYA